MAGAVLNCKKCKRIFQKVSSDMCPACIKLEEEQVLYLYRRLQKSAANGGIPIEELSQELNIPIEDIERFYLEGRLSTGGIFLKTACQSCGVMVKESERKGRYCNTCSEAMASKAGVEVKTLQEMQKAEEEERRRQAQMNLLKSNQPRQDPKDPRRFGFVR